MASSTTMENFTRGSTLPRKTSPFKDPRPAPRTPAPCTPAKTAKAWDEYERQARQNARRRDRASQGSRPQRNSASSDVAKGSRSSTSTARSSYDFKFRNVTIATTAAVSTCKSCKQAITYASGICERCTKTIILPSSPGESTPPLSPAARNFASTDLHLLEKHSSQEEPYTRLSNSSQRRDCPSALQLTNPPVRLDSLRPPPITQEIMEANRSRKASLTDPNEPFLRFQYAHQYAPATYSIPSTPTYPPTSPPSTVPSRVSTRPSSFAQMTSPLTQNTHLPSSARHHSATPSELGHVQHYAPAPLGSVSPPSFHQVNAALQNTTSAWDDWDSDGEEKVRLVGYWKRGGKDKPTSHVSTANLKGKEKERERADSKVSYSSSEEPRSHEKRDKKSKNSLDRKSEKKQSKESSRSESRTSRHNDTKASSVESESYKKHKKRPSGLTRFLSCGR
ncbi:hypothetical protein E8E13_005331 [Curvularia kusanoi]|uniref:Uncharacterized protein n=1 Tax=Curvularia kusanoi TaxID=90978 RepID=A0A9P4TBT3_CURKU|nr:hypothetical protein E8E13_005331 [Curvularia kusanoi]